VDTLVRDLRYSLRVLTREPGFTLLAILTLALGIGATTAIFTVVDSVLLRPLPYRDSDRLVVALHGSDASAPVSPADYVDYRQQARSFEGLGAAQAWSGTLGGGDRPERVAGLQVSANLLDILGVPPLLGRTFVEGDDEAGRDRIAVLSHGLWQRRFAGDQAIVGNTVTIDGRPYTVVGVMPATFRFAPFWQTRAELWVPLTLTARRDDRSGRSLRLFGRLRQGVGVDQAQQEMRTIAARLERDYPDSNTGLSITVRPLLDKVVSGIRATLVTLMSMVTFVLLIASANVASAMLARASGRRQEVAVRLALGASPWRVIRQLITESLLLASAGAAFGFALAVWGVHWLLAMLPPASLPRQQDVGFDVSVFAAATLATLIAGLVTGLVPAFQIARPSLVSGFQGAPRGATEGAHRKWLRSLLVGAEVALALVLLVGAGLMGRTMIALSDVDPGFRVDHLIVADVSLGGTAHTSPAARYPMYQRITERLSALPGVTSASAINHLPLAGDTWNLGYSIDGRPVPPAGQKWSAVYRVVQPGYFTTAGLPLLEGRDFSPADRDGSVPVAIINKTMADRRWPGQSPVGRRMRLPGPSNVQEPITIIGVAANARQSDWTSASSDEVYVALPQRSSEFGLTAMTFLLRTSVDPASVAATIPGVVAELDRGVPVSKVTTMEEVVADVLWRQRLTARLSAGFAFLALVLAAIGIYAAVGYAVARRTREFGVRIALGGTPRQVEGLALFEGLRPVVIGAIVGTAIAFAASGFADRLLFGVRATDPLAFSGSVATLLIVAACAAWIPARRASRSDPMIALRDS
jgi:putative ABC transport system permease protein